MSVSGLYEQQVTRKAKMIAMHPGHILATHYHPFSPQVGGIECLLASTAIHSERRGGIAERTARSGAVVETIFLSRPRRAQCTTATARRSFIPWSIQAVNGQQLV